MRTSIFITITTAALFISLSALAKGGQHNNKRCYVTLSGGATTSSPCSARGTNCADDFSCTIDGIPGKGTHKPDNMKSRKKMKTIAPIAPIKKVPVKKKPTVKEKKGG